MCRRKMVNTLLVVAAFSLLAILALYVRVGATADTVAVLRAEGMTCESCSGKIRKALEREKGVAATEVDVAGGWVVVGFDSKKTGVETLAQRITATGFTATLQSKLSPERFRELTGRSVGMNGKSSPGCCGNKDGGCNVNRQKS